MRHLAVVDALPHGTVTFLFTDIEGSTRLWEEFPAAMRAALAAHDRILGAVFAAHGGYVFATAGDAFSVAFWTPQAALAAAIAAQRRLMDEPWPAPAVVRVRFGVHTGTADERDGDYFGPALNRAARIMTAGAGGQILLSNTTRQVIGDPLPAGVGLRSLGEHHLRDLSAPETVWQVLADGLPDEFGPLRTTTGELGTLPAAPTPCIGREREIARVHAALERARTVSLTGVAGVGKTRLAIEVAAASRGSFPHGVWFCDLAPVTDPGGIPYAVSAALALPHRTSVPSAGSIAAELGSRRALIVLDNCEHLIDAAAQIVAQLTATCAGVQVIATSREPLNVAGEEVIPVRPLDEDSAIGLFLERARAVGAEIDRCSMTSVNEICGRLDGLPLAIELAAARTRSMTPAEIAAMLDQRFLLLGGNRRRATARHQTLRQAIDWSYALLAPDLRTMFDSLGVLIGTFDAAAVMAVADVDELAARTSLDALVERSLVEAEPVAGTTRYRLLETLRQYARDRLADSGSLDRCSLLHALHYANLAEQVRLGIRGPRELAWIARVDAEWANFRAAVSWAVQASEAAVALRLVAGLSDDAWHRQRYEVLAWTSDVLAIPSALDHDLAPRVLGLASRLTTRTGDQRRAAHLAEMAIATETRLGLEPTIVTRYLRASTRWYIGRVDEASVRMEEALALHEAQGLDDYDLFMPALLHTWLLHERDPDRARMTTDKLVTMARRIGTPTLEAWALYTRGTLRRRDDPEAAVSDLGRAMAGADAVRAPYLHDGAELALVSTPAATAAADEQETLARFDRLLQRQLDNGDLLRTATTLHQLGLFLAEIGDHQTAAILRAAGETFPSQPLPALRDPERHDAAVRSAELALDRSTLDTCRSEGHDLSIAEAAAAARSRIEAILSPRDVPRS
jgi:predicted ATPase/class 3 adenylate cyclase